MKFEVKRKSLVVPCSLLNEELQVGEWSLKLILGMAGMKVVNIDMQTLGYICEVTYPSMTTNLYLTLALIYWERHHVE